MKAKKTLRFVVVAIMIAAIFAMGANMKDVMVEIWKYIIEIDKGYMWIINIAIGAVVAILVSQIDSKLAKVISVILFVVAVLVSECLLWHRSEIGATLIEGIIKKETLINTGIGVLASTIAYIILEKGDEAESK